jgi:site-specific DNA recombinase
VGDRVVLGGVAVEHSAPGQHVVDEQDTAGPKPRQQLLCVVAVAPLVGIDEGEVDGCGGGKRTQRCRRGPDAQLDPVGDTGKLPVAAPDRRPLLTDVAAEQVASARQTTRDRQCGIAGEGAHLHGAAHSERGSENGESFDQWDAGYSISMSTNHTRACIYVRVSVETDGATLANQEKICRDLAAKLGWIVEHLYVDDAKSAYSGKPRPDYDLMLAALRGGTLDALVVYDLDRLYRLPRELEDLLDLTDPDVPGRTVLYASPAGYDLATADGRFMARMMVNVANKSSADTQRRVRLSLKAAAAGGRAHGGRRAFGWRDATTTDELGKVTVRRTGDLDEREAAELRTTAANIISGRSLRSECRRLDAAGAHGPTGGNWQGSALRKILLSPRIIGKRSHLAKGTTTPVLSPAAWSPIIDEVTQIQVRSALGNRVAGAQQVSLLGGMLRCGICSGHMHSAPAWGKNARAYIDRQGAVPGAGQHVSISQAKLDAYVVAQVVARSAAPVVVPRAEAKVHATRATLAAAIAADQDKLREIGEAIGGGLNLLVAQSAIAAIEKKIAATEKKLAAVAPQSAPRATSTEAWPPVGGDLDFYTALFGTFDADTQHAVIASMVDRIEVNVLQPGRRVEDRCRIVWQ